ncbi:MAG TPA: hypothetical protein VGL86_08160 [Polyangia bacterium]|jgi:peptidoglycan/LPS O-acetylase OafA/YrhL
MGLALFRMFVGALAMAAPWLVGRGLDGYGAASLGCGVALIAAATQAHRAPWLRWVLAALALAILFLPFAFDNDDISDREIYYATMVGFMALVSSIVSARLFAQDKERTSASEDSKSSGSKTSSVTTPSN